MSSISGTTTSPPQVPQRTPHSERSRPSSAIGGEVSSGAIAATDAAGTSGTAGGARLDPSAIKDRLDGLIAGRVGSGALTSDQATTLKARFAEGGGGGADAIGGAGFGPPPPGPPPGDDAATGPSSASDGAGTASTSDLLASFIKQLQTSQASGGGYASSGSGSAGSTASALLFDFRS